MHGWIAVPSVLKFEAMAKARWDALTIDMQHGTPDVSHSHLTVLANSVHFMNY